MQKVITDDSDALLNVLPPHVRQALLEQPDNSELIEVVLDLGRPPEARYPQKEVILSFLESLTKFTPCQKDIIKSMLKKKRLILENLPPEKKEEILNKLINFAKLSPLERDRVLRQLIRNRR